jgi:nicotinamidase-related amidase
MATVRKGNQPVLLVVDMQVGVMAPAWQAERAIANAALVVRRARDAGVPVIWVQHTDDELPTGSALWQWVPALVPAEGELHIHKHFNSAFEDTPLEVELARLGVTHIVLAGAASNWCIRATAYAALERGYDLTLVSDAHTTRTMQLESGAVVEAESVVNDLNVAMTWLAYPGRRNATATAAQVDFFAVEGPAA